MATEILFSDLKAWLDAQPENTASTPYEIIIKNAPRGGFNTYTNAITRFVRVVDMEMAEGVTSIGERSFISCTNLISINIPIGITSIIAQAFQGCKSLTNVTLPGTLTSIGNMAFVGCSVLAAIYIPYGVTSIGNSAFDACSSLTNVSLPGTLTSIGNMAFRNCKSMQIAYVYCLFSETLMKSESFKGTPSNTRVLVNPTVLSGWQSATLTNYGFASGARVESLYTKWVRVI